MKHKILYIELKSGFSNSGPAWIGEVDYSKSGSTIYFNDMALKKLKIPNVGANHFDIETGEDYWISGVKKNGQDRHQFGSGKVMIDQDCIEDYLKLVDFNIIDNKYFEIIEINKSFDKSRFNNLENSKVDFSEINYPDYSAWYWDKNKRKLVLQ